MSPFKPISRILKLGRIVSALWHNINISCCCSNFFCVNRFAILGHPTSTSLKIEFANATVNMVH